jgi:3-oxoacyl-[acyl-carrier-protein] synthase-3
MYINLINHYLPELIVPNSYFKDKNGLDDEWITKRTGIKERRKAMPGENTQTMAEKAVEGSVSGLPYDISEIDLIIGATYTPFDTVVSLAHSIQNHFNINAAKAVTVTSACSSFVNAVEIVEGYFSMNKAQKALIVASEHNTAYSKVSDVQSGHLWGDGAAAVFISKEKISTGDIKIIDVVTQGLGNVGRAAEAVYLRPLNGGLKMLFGKDIFVNANAHMVDILLQILNKNNMKIDDLSYLVAHQANIRILEHIRKELKLSREKMIVNIDKLGNTGCASTPIAISQNYHRFSRGDFVGVTVFGGGYSSGAMLLEI